MASETKLWLDFGATNTYKLNWIIFFFLVWIKDTLKSPPPENKTMKMASMISIFVTTFFYLCCGCFGYAAFGNDTPGNLLTGFGFYEPYWLIDFANACIVLHLVGGYQVILPQNTYNTFYFLSLVSLLTFLFMFLIYYRFSASQYLHLWKDGLLESTRAADLWTIFTLSSYHYCHPWELIFWGCAFELRMWCQQLPLQ